MQCVQRMLCSMMIRRKRRADWRTLLAVVAAHHEERREGAHCMHCCHSFALSSVAEWQRALQQQYVCDRARSRRERLLL